MFANLKAPTFILQTAEIYIWTATKINDESQRLNTGHFFQPISTNL